MAVRAFAIVNQKGGCGKTTTAISLAGVFASWGYRTLLVDMDPQSHCAAGLAIPEQRIDLHIGDAMSAPEGSPVDPSRLLWRVSRNLDLAPSTTRLAAMEAARGPLAEVEHPERRLQAALRPLAERYDICLVDCSPTIGLLTFNALAAADEVIVPVETGFFSLQGATKQVNTIKSLGKRLGRALPYRLLPTMHDPSSVLSRDLLEELRRRFSGKVIPQVIRYDPVLREAASFGQPVTEYGPESAGARDYSSLAGWLLAQPVLSGLRRVEEGVAVPRPAPDVHVVRGGGSGGGESERARAKMGHVEPKPRRAEAESDLGDEDTGSEESGLPSSGARADESAGVSSRTADLLARVQRLAKRVEAANGVGEFGVGYTAQAGTSVYLEEHESARPVSEPAPSAARIFGVRQTSLGTLFVQPASMGERVCIAGDFNAWSPDATRMRLNRELGVFEACVQLPPGPVQYRLVVDGQWMTDPYNPKTTRNPFGDSNSIFVVPGQAGEAGDRNREQSRAGTRGSTNTQAEEADGSAQSKR